MSSSKEYLDTCECGDALDTVCDKFHEFAIKYSRNNLAAALMSRGHREIEPLSDAAVDFDCCFLCSSFRRIAPLINALVFDPLENKEDAETANELIDSLLRIPQVLEYVERCAGSQDHEMLDLELDFLNLSLIEGVFDDSISVARLLNEAIDGAGVQRITIRVGESDDQPLDLTFSAHYKRFVDFDFETYAPFRITNEGARFNADINKL